MWRHMVLPAGLSQENVEVVEEVLQGFRQFDAGGRPPEDFWTDDSLLTLPDGWPEPGPFKGRATIMRQFEHLFDDFSAFHSSVREVVAQREDWVVVTFFWVYTPGAASDLPGRVQIEDPGLRGVEGTWEVAAAFRVNVKERCCIEAHYRWDRQEALDAAGLSE